MLNPCSARTGLREPLRSAGCLLGACIALVGCTRTRIDLRVEARDELGASALQIVVRDGNGEEVYRRSGAFGAENPALLPVYETRGETTFSFELIAQDGDGAELASVLGRTEFVSGARREVHVRLCDDEVCENERCFEAAILGEGPQAGESCAPPVDCASAADGTRCDGERGTCEGGRCCWCFDGGTCVEQTELAPSTCGRGGGACEACCADEACGEGACEVGVPFERVGAGVNFACASTAEGDVYCWGQNEFGALGELDSSIERVRPTFVGAFGDVSVGALHVNARRGTAVLGWGLNDVREAGVPGLDIVFGPSPVAGAWREVATGERHSCGVQSDGTLSCYGGNRELQLGDPEIPDGALPTFLASPLDLRALSAGTHTMAIGQDGFVYGWGQNVEEEETGACAGCVRRAHPNDPSQWVDVAAGERFACGIQEGGELSCWGAYLPELFPEGGRQVVTHPRGLAFESVEAWRSVCALDEEGELWCWGYDLLQNTPNATPRRVSLGSERWSAIGTFKHQTICGISSGGGLYCFGRALVGDFGAPGMTTSATPVRMCPAE